MQVCETIIIQLVSTILIYHFWLVFSFKFSALGGSVSCLRVNEQILAEIMNCLYMYIISEKLMMQV